MPVQAHGEDRTASTPICVETVAGDHRFETIDAPREQDDDLEEPNASLEREMLEKIRLFASENDIEMEPKDQKALAKVLARLQSLENKLYPDKIASSNSFKKDYSRPISASDKIQAKAVELLRSGQCKDISEARTLVWGPMWHPWECDFILETSSLRSTGARYS